MKVLEFRTQAFKDKVKNIAYMKVTDTDGKLDKIQFNFTTGGETKPIRIDGIDVADCVAYYKIATTIGNRTHVKPYAITYNDVISFERMMKLKQIAGEKVEIKSTRKVRPQEAPEFIPEVGKFYGFGNNGLIKIIGKTATTFKYEEWYCRVKEDKISDRYNEMREKGYEYNEWLDIETSIDIIGPRLDTSNGVLRLNKYGTWGNGKDYSYRSADVKFHLHSSDRWN